jgi:hypothetical protein
MIEKKLRNLTYVLGAADEVVGCIRGDVAVVCTHSDFRNLKLVAQQFAPQVIDVYGEIVEANPDAFDPLASRLRAAS